MSWSWITNTLYAMGGVGAVTLTVLYFYQEKLLYFPSMPGLPKRPEENPRGYRNPGEYGIEYEDLTFSTKDKVKIHAWLLRHHDRPEQRPTLLYFHGNAGNIGFRLPNAVELYRRSGVNIMMVEYRGYGRSEGVPTEEGLLLDAEAALEKARHIPYIDRGSIISFGRSLGGAVALALAERFHDQLAATVVENTFLDIGSMVDVLMPIVAMFKSLVLRMEWSNAKRIKHISHPILFLAGGKDELVPHDHMLSLFQSAENSRGKDMHIIPDGTHNDTWVKGGPLYYEKIRKFIEKSLGRTLHPLPGFEYEADGWERVQRQEVTGQDERAGEKAIMSGEGNFPIKDEPHIPSMLDQPGISAVARSRKGKREDHGKEL